MQWGKTHAQRCAEMDLLKQRGKTCFAWIPTRMDDSVWIWLQMYRMRWDERKTWLPFASSYPCHGAWVKEVM